MCPFRYGEASETCPECNSVLEIRDVKWVQRDQTTWDLVKESYCPGCKLTGNIILRTFVKK